MLLILAWGLRQQEHKYAALITRFQKQTINLPQIEIQVENKHAGGLQEVIGVFWIWKTVGKVHMCCITGYMQSFWQERILLYLCVNGREVRNFKWLFWDWEIFLTVAIGTRCACLMNDLIPPARQRYALFFAGHPSVSAQLLRFWLYFMSPNCDWPGLPEASFHPRRRGPLLLD